MADRKASPRTKSSTAEAQRSATQPADAQDGVSGPRSATEGFLTLYHCLRHNGGGSIDFDAASQELGISRNAAYKRWIRMKAFCEKADVEYKRDMAEKLARRGNKASGEKKASEKVKEEEKKEEKKEEEQEEI